MAAPDGSPTNGNDKARLTDSEKKRNHIVSEQKRREAIREGFDKLASIVPGMEGQGRSEAIVLAATVEYLRDQLDKKEVLRQKARDQLHMSDREFEKAYQGADKAVREAERDRDAGVGSSRR